MAKWTRVKNAGFVAQIVPVAGGTQTIKPGADVNVEDLLPMSDEQLVHYKTKGITFLSTRNKQKKSTDVDAKIKAEADAKVKADAVAKAKADADAKDKADADAKAKAAGNA